MKGGRRDRGKQRLFLLCILVQAAVLAALGALILKRDASPVVIEAGANYWNSETAIGLERGADMGLIFDEDIHTLAPFDEMLDHAGSSLHAKDYEGVKAATALDCALTAGSYTVTINYQCDYDQYVTPGTGPGLGALMDSGKENIRLPADQTSISFDIYVPMGMDAFRLDAWYNRCGAFIPGAIRISSNTAMLRMLLTALLVIFAAVDTMILKRKRIAENRTMFTALTGLIVLISLPLTVPWLGKGNDLVFHLCRIEALYQGLMRGELPVRIAAFVNQGAGYATPVMYCDLFLFFPAMLRVIGFPLNMAYKLYILAVNIAAVMIAWKSFRPILKNRAAAFTATSLWVTAAYRFGDVYTRAAVGEYTAMIFLPMVLLALYRIYGKEKVSLPREILTMAAAMTGIVCSHVLTLEIAVLICAVFAVVSFRRTFTKECLIFWAASAVMTILMGLWFLVPFVDYGLNVPMWINAYLKYSTYWLRIGQSGATLAGFLDPFRNIYAMADGLAAQKVLVSPGLPLLLVMAAGLFIALHEKGVIRYLMAAIALLSWMCTDLFPWDLWAATPFGTFFNAVQFPWRYEMAVCLLTSFLGGLLLLRVKEKCPGVLKITACVMCCLCAMMAMYNTSGYISGCTEHMDVHSAAGMSGSHESNGEYERVVPFEEDTPWGVKEAKRGEAVVDMISREGTSMILHAAAGAEEATVDIPYVNYKGYHVTDDSGLELDITDNEKQRIRVVIPANYDGMLNVRFEEPLTWRIAGWVSLIAQVMTVRSIILQRRKRIKR